MRLFGICASTTLLFHLTSLSQTPDTNFRIVLSHFTSNPVGIVARITTTATYPCTGYRLQTRVTNSNDTVKISLGGLISPTPCFQAFDNAKGSAYLGDLTPGIYIFAIAFRDAIDHYEITVVRNNVFVQPIRQDFTEVTIDD